jgi:hypothetical protein
MYVGKETRNVTRLFKNTNVKLITTFVFLSAFSDIFISSHVGTSEDAVFSLSPLIRSFPPIIMPSMTVLSFRSSWKYSFHLCFIPLLSLETCAWGLNFFECHIQVLILKLFTYLGQMFI